VQNSDFLFLLLFFTEEYSEDVNSALKRDEFSPMSRMTDCQLRRTVNSEQSKPECLDDGSYRSFQCDQYTPAHRHECWCVYDNGEMIKGLLSFELNLKVLYVNVNYAK